MVKNFMEEINQEEIDWSAMIDPAFDDTWTPFNF